jgi:spoIIIJ-associated protein
MSYIDVTGKTEEEAIQNALAQLGMDRDDVSVEILERAKSGFLGMGAKPARVRVTYGPDEAPMEEVAVPVKPAVVEKPEKKEEPQPKPQQPKQPRPQQSRPQQPKQAKPQPKREEKAAPVEKPAAPAVELPECTDDNAVRITAFLTGLLEHMDSPAAVKVYEEEKGRYKVILEGQKLGALIGRRGETLDAIQQLTNYAVNSGSEKRIRVHVDAENYRARREASLESLAMKVAGKVKKYRRSVTLEAMNAYERHVIHAALQDVKGVTTYSVGTEPNRRVVVAYDRGENN